MNEVQNSICQHIGSLMAASFRISNRLNQLHLIREKILARGYQPFDKADIMNELGQLQHISNELNRAMLSIYDLVKQDGNK